jgi:hypothetical protein
MFTLHYGIDRSIDRGAWPWRRSSSLLRRMDVVRPA